MGTTLTSTRTPRMTYRMGRRDGVGSFSDKVTLRAVRGAQQMSWGLFYEFTWEHAPLTVTKVLWKATYFWRFGRKKQVRIPLERSDLRGFPLPTAGHQFADGFARRLPMMQDCVHLSGDGHFHLMNTCQFDRSVCGENSLRHHAVHARNDVRQFTTTAEFNTNTAIAGQSSRAGQHQISQAGQSSHGFWLPAAGYHQARHLRQAAGDERRNRVMAQSQPVANSGSDRDGILQRASQFHADHVVVGINPKLRIAELILHGFGQPIVRRSDGDGGRISPRHLCSKRRSAQRPHPRTKSLR